jgi:putative spermidine/putrescine transport system substrate-binding protein
LYHLRHFTLGRTCVSRRAVLRAAGGIALAGVAPAIVARAADSLVVNAYGGEFGDILKSTVIAPFEKKFGVQVVFDDTGTSSTNYAKIRATRGAPGFDVAAELTAAENFLGASEKLLLPISEKEVPNLAHVWAKSREMIPPNGTVNYYQYASLFYNTAKVKRPTSWLDYFAPAATYGEAIKGRLLAFNPANVLEIYAIAMGAKTQGGGIADMEPGFKLLAQQKPFIAEVPTMSSAAVPFFENGTVWLAPFWSARAAYYRARGMPFDFVIPKEGTMGLGGTSGIPINAANPKLALEFLNFRLDPDIQRAFCLAYYASPARPDIPDLPADFIASQITTEAAMAALDLPDAKIIGAKIRDWTLRFQEIMS